MCVCVWFIVKKKLYNRFHIRMNLFFFKIVHENIAANNCMGRRSMNQASVWSVLGNWRSTQYIKLHHCDRASSSSKDEPVYGQQVYYRTLHSNKILFLKISRCGGSNWIYLRENRSFSFSKLKIKTREFFFRLKKKSSPSMLRIGWKSIFIFMGFRMIKSSPSQNISIRATIDFSPSLSTK